MVILATPTVKATKRITRLAGQFAAPSETIRAYVCRKCNCGNNTRMWTIILLTDMLTSGKERVLTCMQIHILDQTTSEEVVLATESIGGIAFWELKQYVGCHFIGLSLYLKIV